MKKTTDVEGGKGQVESENNKLKDEKKQLKLQAAELQAKIEAIEKREEDSHAQKEKESVDETNFLKRRTRQLKQILTEVIVNLGKFQSFLKPRRTANSGGGIDR